jgi:hypothetical protein
MTHRLARCSCEQLTLSVTGDPVRISVCHCLACQQRTGSAFGFQARFADSQVQISGRVGFRAGDARADRRMGDLAGGVGNTLEVFGLRREGLRAHAAGATPAARVGAAMRLKLFPSVTIALVRSIKGGTVAMGCAGGALRRLVSKRACLGALLLPRAGLRIVQPRR